MRLPLQRPRWRIVRGKRKQRELLRFDLALPGDRHDPVSVLLDVEGVAFTRCDLHDVHAGRNVELERRRRDRSLCRHAYGIYLFGPRVRFTRGHDDVGTEHGERQGEIHERGGNTCLHDCSFNEYVYQFTSTLSTGVMDTRRCYGTR